MSWVYQTKTSPPAQASMPQSPLENTAIPHVQGLYIAAARGRPMQAVARVTAVAGQGLAGDRYHDGAGTFSSRAALVPGARALSLIDTADIARCNNRLNSTLGGADLRRNIVVDGIDLLAWRDQRFALGDVIIRIAGRCAPCGLLSRYAGHDMRTGLYRGGGMRAVVEIGGEIRIDQPFVALD